MPGHGHQDLGSFELHDGTVPVIVDPGRGSYAASQYEEAGVHNGLTIDGKAPTPVNKPYYTAAFRERIVPAAPQMKRIRDGQVLGAAGFEYMKAVKSAEREWQFTDSRVEIRDRVDGRGRHVICRRFCTPLSVTREADAVIMSAGPRSYRLSPGMHFRLADMTCWSAYGEGRPATQIILERDGPLPFDAVVTIERI
jgi:hypothetical protein